MLKKGTGSTTGCTWHRVKLRSVVAPVPISSQPGRLLTINGIHLRAAVLDKNFHFFRRYRTTDGYSIFGGRAGLTFVDGQTDREVMQREMEILDAMTANRDRRIWATRR